MRRVFTVLSVVALSVGLLEPCTIFTVTKEVFFLRCMTGRFTARRSADGAVTGLLMEQAGSRIELDMIVER